MQHLPCHVIALFPLCVQDLLRLGATCRHAYCAVDAALGLRSDIRMPISFAPSELTKSKWDALECLEVFLATSTVIEPTRRVHPIPRRFEMLTRLHLRDINLPATPTEFWTGLFHLVPRLETLIVDIVTYPTTRSVTYNNVESLVDIGAPRLVELQIHERGSLILGNCGSYVHRVESDTLQKIHITGIHVPNTCIDAPLTSAVIEETMSAPQRGVSCLGPRSHDTLTDLEMIVHHTYDIAKVRAFRALKRLRVTLHAPSEASVILLSELSNKLAGTPIQELDLRLHGPGASCTNAATWTPPPVTFRGVFKGLEHLRTLRIAFRSTPSWITNLVCGIDAPALSNVYLESDTFGLSAWQYGLATGSLDASRLRAYLSMRPTLRISTKNIAHV